MEHFNLLAEATKAEQSGALRVFIAVGVLVVLLIVVAGKKGD